MTDHGRRGRIVVGVDASPSSVLAMRWALRQAVQATAGVELIWCWDRATPFGDAPDGPDPTAVMREALAVMVTRAVADVEGGHHVPVRQTVTRGYAPRILVEQSRGADVLVVGSRGHSPLREVMLGSVGLHCATHATCPVLIMRATSEDPS